MTEKEMLRAIARAAHSLIARKDFWETVPAAIPGEYDDLTETIERWNATVFPRTAIDDVAAERQRQIEVEGWGTEHDDAHAPGELSRAGACYALCDDDSIISDPSRVEPEPFAVNALPASLWPWEGYWWKPKDTRRNKILAAALIVADIERDDRAKKSEPRESANKAS